MPEIRLTDRSVHPPHVHPGQVRPFAYHQEGTNQWIEAHSFHELVFNVKKHRMSNNLPIGLMIEDEIDAQIASKVAQGFTSNLDGTANILIPRHEWPAWAKVVALAKNDSDIGVGDTVERTIGPIASEAFKSWFHKITGRPCACNFRKDKWNNEYRYD